MALMFAICRPQPNWMPEEAEAHVPDLPEAKSRLFHGASRVIGEVREKDLNRYSIVLTVSAPRVVQRGARRDSLESASDARSQRGAVESSSAAWSVVAHLDGRNVVRT